MKRLDAPVVLFVLACLLLLTSAASLVADYPSPPTMNNPPPAHTTDDPPPATKNCTFLSDNCTSYAQNSCNAAPTGMTCTLSTSFTVTGVEIYETRTAGQCTDPLPGGQAKGCIDYSPPVDCAILKCYESTSNTGGSLFCNNYGKTCYKVIAYVNGRICLVITH